MGQRDIGTNGFCIVWYEWGMSANGLMNYYIYY